MADKNGAIIFVYMPESGDHWADSIKQYPKEIYWRAFAENCGAPAIHFADYPELAKFECPEGSHLGHKDALEFTRNLSSIIRELDILP